MEAASPATRRALGWWVTLAVALLATVALSSADAAAQDAAPDGPQGLTGVENGSLLYAQQCASCHGAGGAGGEVPEYGGQAPALLPDENPNITVAYLDLVMSTGRMPPAGSPYDNRERQVVFDESERDDLIAWMVQEFDVPGGDLEVGEGDAAAGQEVWAANCAHCHGSTGQGGVAGAGAWTPSVVDKTPEEIAQSIRVGPFQMPRFEDGQITDAEVDDVVAFMAVVAEEPATPILGLVELNPVYASGFVIALAALLLVSLVWIGGKPKWFPDPPKATARGGGPSEVPAGARRRGGDPTHPATATRARDDTDPPPPATGEETP